MDIATRANGLHIVSSYDAAEILDDSFTLLLLVKQHSPPKCSIQIWMYQVDIESVEEIVNNTSTRSSRLRRILNPAHVALFWRNSASRNSSEDFFSASENYTIFTTQTPSAAFIALMALTTHSAKAEATTTPYQLDPEQTLKASRALLTHLREETKRLQLSPAKKELLKTEDSESEEDSSSNGLQTPVWLTLTTKQHIVDKNRLRPSKIPVPHSLNASSDLSICIISADPQRALKNVVADEAFPPALSQRITTIIGLEKLKARYKSFEQRRSFRDEHDIFLADDRIIDRLPDALGKIFYKGTSKRPVPIDVALHERQNGKRVKIERKKKSSDERINNVASPEAVAKEIHRALDAVPVSLKPGTSVAVRVGLASFSADQIADNVQAVVDRVIEKHVVKGWKNIKSIHIKSPTSVALPIWLGDELWADSTNVEAADKEDGELAHSEDSKKRKRSQHTKKGPQTGQRKKTRRSDDGQGQQLAAEKARAFSEAAKAVMV